MDKWELAYKDYTSGMKYKDIAGKYDVSINTVKSWKSRKWNKPPNKKVAHKKEKVAHKEKAQLVIDNDDLTEQQKMFCLYYLQSFNATQSYLKAYKCSYETAMANGYKLLRNAHVKVEIDRVKIELQSEQYFTIQDIINEYARQWKADIKNYVEFGRREIEVQGMFGPIKDEDGNILMKEVNFVDFKDSNSVDGSLVKRVKLGKDGAVVELYDKQKAMSELMKYLGGDTLREAQVKKLGGDGNSSEVEDWKQKVIEAANKRVRESDEQ